MTAQAAPLLGDVVLLTAMTEDFRLAGTTGERSKGDAQRPPQIATANNGPPQKRPRQPQRCTNKL